MSAKQFLVIGTGRFGSAVAVTLADLGHEVVAVDRDEAALAQVQETVTHAMIIDASDEDALRRLGIRSFDTVVVAIGENLEASILATVAAKTAGARHVVSKANGRTAARVLASVGADEVIQPERDMGARLARQLAASSMVDAFELDGEHQIMEVDAARRLAAPLQDLELPNRFNVQVLAVYRGADFHVNPGADFQVYERDRLVVIGANRDLERFCAHNARGEE